MRAADLLQESAQPQLTLVLTKCYDAEGDDDGYYASGPGFVFDIMRNGSKVGELVTGSGAAYYADWQGELDGKKIKFDNESVFDAPQDNEVEKSKKAQRTWTKYAEELLNKYVNGTLKVHTRASKRMGE